MPGTNNPDVNQSPNSIEKVEEGDSRVEQPIPKEVPNQKQDHQQIPVKAPKRSA